MELSVLDRAFFFSFQSLSQNISIFRWVLSILLLCMLKGAAQSWPWEPLVPEEEQEPEAG